MEARIPVSEADHDQIQPWHVEQSQELLDCRIFKVRRESEHTADGTKHGDFYVLDAPDWVNIVPITPDRQLVCVVQYRHGSRHIAIETPAGLVEAGEAPEAAAARELREETGYSARSLQVLGQLYANPAFLNNRVTVILARDVTLTDPTAWDEHEELELRLVPVENIPDMLARGEVENSVSALALGWYLLHTHGILPPQETDD
jgi:8-oxo-dGTP pyrophosphatase MutT (NUDIX family)